MEENFISVHEAMPPLNRLCEVKTISGSIHKARLFQENNNATLFWHRTKDDGTNVKVNIVIAWRVIETKEKTNEWFDTLR